jgi:hypothetical protein
MAKDQPRERAITATPSAPKKPYRAPRLVEYGDLRTITRAKGGTMGEAPLPATKK